MLVATRRSHLRSRSISGLVVEYVVAIDVTRVRFPADAYYFFLMRLRELQNSAFSRKKLKVENLGIDPSASRMLSERSTI